MDKIYLAYLVILGILTALVLFENSNRNMPGWAKAGLLVASILCLSKFMILITI